MKHFNHLRNTRYGMLIYNQYDTFIGRSIEMYGEWANEEMELWKQFIRPGMTVLDIGANIGVHTIGLARIVGDTGKVYAFEPQRQIFYMLAGNVALNSLKNVWCFQKAVSNSEEDIFVPELDFESMGNFGALRIGEFNEKLVEKKSELKGEYVPSVKIDNLNLEDCHFIKIDVEGMEEQVLKGAVNTISKHRPWMYVENNQPDKSKSLIRFIDQLGYDMYWHISKYYNPNNYFENPYNIFGDGGDPNMLCVPKESKLKVEGAQKVLVE